MTITATHRDPLRSIREGTDSAWSTRARPRQTLGAPQAAGGADAHAVARWRWTRQPTSRSRRVQRLENMLPSSMAQPKPRGGTVGTAGVMLQGTDGYGGRLPAAAQAATKDDQLTAVGAVRADQAVEEVMLTTIDEADPSASAPWMMRPPVASRHRPRRGRALHHSGQPLGPRPRTARPCHRAAITATGLRYDVRHPGSRP